MNTTTRVPALSPWRSRALASAQAEIAAAEAALELAHEQGGNLSRLRFESHYRCLWVADKSDPLGQKHISGPEADAYIDALESEVAADLESASNRLSAAKASLAYLLP